LEQLEKNGIVNWSIIYSLHFKRMSFLPTKSEVVWLFFPKPSVNNSHTPVLLHPRPVASNIVWEFFILVLLFISGKNGQKAKVFGWNKWGLPLAGAILGANRPLSFLWQKNVKNHQIWFTFDPNWPKLSQNGQYYWMLRTKSVIWVLL